MEESAGSMYARRGRAGAYRDRPGGLRGRARRRAQAGRHPRDRVRQRQQDDHQPPHRGARDLGGGEVGRFPLPSSGRGLDQHPRWSRAVGHARRAGGRAVRRDGEAGTAGLRAGLRSCGAGGDLRRSCTGARRHRGPPPVGAPARPKRAPTRLRPDRRGAAFLDRGGRLGAGWAGSAARGRGIASLSASMAGAVSFANMSRSQSGTVGGAGGAYSAYCQSWLVPRPFCTWARPRAGISTFGALECGRHVVDPDRRRRAAGLALCRGCAGWLWPTQLTATRSGVVAAEPRVDIVVGGSGLAGDVPALEAARASQCRAGPRPASSSPSAMRCVYRSPAARSGRRPADRCVRSVARCRHTSPDHEGIDPVAAIGEHRVARRHLPGGGRAGAERHGGGRGFCAGSKPKRAR